MAPKLRSAWHETSCVGPCNFGYLSWNLAKCAATSGPECKRTTRLPHERINLPVRWGFVSLCVAGSPRSKIKARNDQWVTTGFTCALNMAQNH